MARPCLILIPGLLNDAEMWREVAALLSEMVDVRVADITQGETLEELAATALENAPGAVSVAGFSLGGYVAQQMARQAPERIDRLALIDTSMRPDTPARAAERKALDAAVRLPGRFHGFGDRLMHAYLAPGHADDEVMTGRVRAMTQRLGVEVLLRQNALHRPDGEAVLRGFAGPVLVACGEYDAITPLAGHEEMAAMTPRAVLEVIPGAGHLTPIEAPVPLALALARWMARR